MNNLPVREMVLYKHGVGFFVREGELDGTEATLTFRAEEVNDILKSLAVFDRSGGQVYGVHYQTPMDRQHRLANTSIRLDNKNSITQLLQQLRGRQVTLVVADTKGKQFTYTGRVIGTEEQHAPDFNSLYYVSLIGSDGSSHIFPFASIQQFTIRDDQSKQDLTYFLDTSMSEDNRRTVTVRMSEGKHELVVHYVAPSPTWRVSYRLVAETDEDESNTGTALLQGWGLFDNRFEEDLDDVKVTLVAGQPISFIYDLYESKIPERPVVKDEARVVEAPVEYRSEVLQAKAAAPVSTGYMMMDHAPEERSRGISSEGYREMMESSTSVSTETKETGETFQYSVTTPVTVKRGESALVPILGHTVNYERELLYNNDKLADHPVASLRFENQTGLTLERGPVTLVEDGDYKGEAIIPFTKDKHAVYVPYAVDLGVTVREDFQRNVELHSLSISEEYLKQQIYIILVTTYTIENATDKDKTVTIEAPIQPHFDLFETREPDVKTLETQRWKVDVPANDTVEFVKKVRQMQYRNEEIRRIQYHELDRYLENKYIDNNLVDDLRSILEASEAIAVMHKQINMLSQETKSIYEKQDQLRKNMGSLGTAGKEGTLRQRVVDQLEASQDRLEAIESEIANLKASIEQTEATINEMIQALGEKYQAE